MCSCPWGWDWPDSRYSPQQLHLSSYATLHLGLYSSPNFILSWDRLWCCSVSYRRIFQTSFRFHCSIEIGNRKSIAFLDWCSCNCSSGGRHYRCKRFPEVLLLKKMGRTTFWFRVS
jgi:hypothetical protein